MACGVVLGCGLAPASALAARSWQPEQTLPADRALNLDLYVVDGAGTMALDGAGNGLVLTRQPPNQGFAVRPHGGSLGAPVPLPPLVGSNYPYNAFITTDALGDAFAFDQYHTSVASRAPGVAAMTGESTNGIPPGVGQGLVVTDVAVAPGGAALAIGAVTLALDDRAGVLFRPAGSASAWGIPTLITLPPALGDNRTVPVGVALDADGGAVAVYRSLPSGAILQTFRPAGDQNFGQPSQIPGAEPFHFSHGADGTAIIGWLAGTGPDSVHAAVRAPGQPFGAPQTVASRPGLEVGNEVFAAGEAGHAVVAWSTALNDYSSCGPANLTGSSYGWEASAFTHDASGTAGTWAAAGHGANGWPNRSRPERLRIAGDTFAFVTREVDDLSGTRCNEDDDTHTLRAYVGSVASLATSSIEATPGTAVAQGTSNSSWPLYPLLAVNASGDALFGYLHRPDATSRLMAYEDPAAVPAGPGGSGGGGGAGASGPSVSGPAPKPITAPGGIKITGPIIVSGRGLVPLRTTCNATDFPCAYAFAMFGVTNGALTAKARKAPKAIGHATGTIPAGTTRTVKVKLDRATIKLLTRKKRLKVKLVATITSGSNKATITKVLVLRSSPASSGR